MPAKCQTKIENINCSRFVKSYFPKKELIGCDARAFPDTVRIFFFEKTQPNQTHSIFQKALIC